MEIPPRNEAGFAGRPRSDRTHSVPRPRGTIEISLRGTRGAEKLRTAFRELDQRVQRMINRGGHSELRAAARDVAVQRINLRAFAAHHVLRRRRKRFGHLCGDLERAVERGQGICAARGMNTSGVRYRPDFVHASLDAFARAVATAALALPDLAERLDGIHRAIPDAVR